MKSFDGKKQRLALTAAEQALRALGSGDGGKARARAAKALALDQVGSYEQFAVAISPLADGLDRGEPVDGAGWDSLAATLGMGPLSFLIDELRGE